MSRIQTNVPAMNTLRQLGISSRMFARSVGRLSSGFRINRAADDAAGLGIANTLRADIRATRQAARNAEQGNSVLQVMEGGAQQLSGILERMKELAAQAASDSVNASARVSINNEFDQLSEEVDRIVSTTKFQGQSLMDGTYGSSSSSANGIDATAASSLGSTSGFTVTTANVAKVEALTTGDLTLAIVQADATGTESVGAGTGLDGTVAFAGSNATLKTLEEGSYTVGYDSASDEFFVSSDGTYLNAEATVDASSYTASSDVVIAGITLSGAAGDATAAGDVSYGTVTIGQSFTATLSGGGAADSTATLDASGSAQTVSFGNHGISLKLDAAQNDLGVITDMGSNDKVTIASVTTTKAQFLVSASGDYATNDVFELAAVNLTATTLGVNKAAIDLTTGSGAQSALSAIDSAILSLNTTFSSIGAAQNRMDFAFANAQSMVENLSAAESVIRDTDMAFEITQMTKFQILQQAGTAMLAQANSAPQGVLALLR